MDRTLLMVAFLENDLASYSRKTAFFPFGEIRAIPANFFDVMKATVR
jgi:hypothetical protein